jgi:choline dehydrogenase
MMVAEKGADMILADAASQAAYRPDVTELAAAA